MQSESRNNSEKKTFSKSLNIPKEDFSEIAKETIKVFNFNAGLRDADQALQDAIDLMEAAW